MSVETVGIATDHGHDRREAPEKGDAYVPAIDGLRAAAVLSVMVYHLKLGALPGGFVGVDVFFVISGFVVTLSIHKRHFASVGALLAYFYARRLVRIAPALLAMLLLTSFLAIAFIPYAWLSDANRKTAFYAFFGLSNVLLARTSDDYFGPRTDFNPFVHTWSLGVEEQFYLVFPLLIGAAVLAWSRGNAFSLGVTITLSILSLALCIVVSPADPIFSFFQIPTRFWELGIGAALALSSTHWTGLLERRSRITLDVISLAAIAALLASFVLCDERRFPFPWALLPVLASAATICVLFTRRPTLAQGLFSSRLFVAIGLLSYSLYLWHWPIYVLLRWTAGLDTLALQAVAIAATFAAAVLSYRFVEQPCRKSAVLRHFPRSRVVALFLVAAFAGAVVSRTMFHFNSDLTLSVTKNAPVWSPYDLTLSNGGCALATSSQETAAATTSEISAPCGPGPKRRLFVAGDSHATAYTRLLARLASQEGYAVTMYTKLGCPFFNFRTPSTALSHACQEFAQTTRASILNDVRAGDFVFLPSLRIARYRDQWGGDLETAQTSAQEVASAVFEARQFFQALSQRGAIVVIEAPTPVFKSPPFRCSDWFNRSNAVCAAGFSMPRSEIEDRRAEIIATAGTLAATISGVTVWDPVSTLCNREQCNAYDDSGPLFFDGDHLSGHGNDVLYRSFVDHLRKYARANPD